MPLARPAEERTTNAAIRLHDHRNPLRPSVQWFFKFYGLARVGQAAGAATIFLAECVVRWAALDTLGRSESISALENFDGPISN